MSFSPNHPLHEQYTGLSDRFRSLWTFYQFLGGVFKHQGRGPLPLTCDFHALHRRLQDALPQIGLEDISPSKRELERIEAELTKVHGQMAKIEHEFPPSILRRFFDHLKRHDQKILFALVKFYLMSETLQEDDLDKLDILLTRLAEAPSVDDLAGVHGLSDLRSKLDRLAEFGRISPVPDSEAQVHIDEIRELRQAIRTIDHFGSLMKAGVLDRYRKFKHRLGRAFMYPPILTEIITTNLAAKERFKELYQDEEVRILEDTNRIFEIERYLDRNPDMAHPELRQQIETFKRYRSQFDSGRKEDNIKGEDVLELRQSMLRLIDSFDAAQSTAREGEPVAEPAPPPVAAVAAPPPEQEAEPILLIDADEDDLPEPPPAEPRGFFDPPAAVLGHAAEPEAVEVAAPLDDPTEPTEPVEIVEMAADEVPTHFGDDPQTEVLSESLVITEEEAEAPSLQDLVAPEPLLVDTLQKIAYALEIIAWDTLPEQAVYSQELHHLRLEPWEVESFCAVMEQRHGKGTLYWELQCFSLLGAALRVKMEEEAGELARLNQAAELDRLQVILDQASQSLERAADFERRFQWFIDDLLYRGETARLAQVYRCRFRFLQAYTNLWLEHQACGGDSPL